MGRQSAILGRGILWLETTRIIMLCRRRGRDGSKESWGCGK